MPLSRRTFLQGAAAATACAAIGADAPPRLPNIVFILADDLGCCELGCFGQKKIRTPNLDRLAAQGMRFTQHYSGNAVCAPSRCALMTGLHPGHAFIRDNREAKPEGQFPIPENTVTIPRLLKRLGYATGAMGKWGLGGPGTSGDPLKQGFDRFFGYNCQRHAHNYYPTYLWDNDRRVELDNPPFASAQKLPEGADPSSPDSYRAYAGKTYAPDLINEQARQFVRDHRDRPFFLYLPTTVPHLALQVPEDSLEEYRGLWPDPPYPGGNGYLPHRTPRAAYAAMITRMDREIGRLMDLLRQLSLDDNTLIIFASDNGPTYERLGGSDSDFFGSAGPFRGLKGSLYEGGIRVPAIARWNGRIAPGTATDRVSGFEDWLPTMLDVAGAQELKNTDGISLLPTLLGKPENPRPYLYREFPGYGGQQSLRMGNLKGIRQNLLRRPTATQPAGKLELYDLDNDPGESKDLAAQRPDVIARMTQLLRHQHTPSAEFPFPALDNDSGN